MTAYRARKPCNPSGKKPLRVRAPGSPGQAREARHLPGPPHGGPSRRGQGGQVARPCSHGAPFPGGTEGPPAASLDSSGVTRSDELRSEERSQLAGRQKRCRKHAPEKLAALTVDVRARKAKRYRAGGKTFAAARRAEWRLNGGAARHGDRLVETVPKVWPWHEARAKGIGELFERIESCGRIWEAVTRCTSDQCSAARREGASETGVRRIPVGCSSRFFCDDCKTTIALRFRRQFNAARLGIRWVADLGGRTERWRPKSGREARFGERMITLTAPHEGTTRERVKWLFGAWPGFLRRFNEWQRSQLGDALVNEGDRKRENPKRDEKELRAAELCHTSRFTEWTPGSDGKGHPHFHVWHFGPFVPQELIEQWWRESWQAVSGVETDRVMVDVRRVLDGQVDEVDGDGNRTGKKARLERELIKYLTKDWTAEPEVFAEVYAELIDRRARQTSSGFAWWAVPKVDVCPCCGLVRDEEDPPVWTIEASVDSVWAYELEPPSRKPLAPGLDAPPAPPSPEDEADPRAWRGYLAYMAREVETRSMAVRALSRGLIELSRFIDRQGRLPL